MNVIVGGRHGGKGQELRWHVGEESHVLSYLMCVVKDGREMKDHIFDMDVGPQGRNRHLRSLVRLNIKAL